MNRPTQVRHPWRTTFRTGFQVVVAAASLLPLLLAGVEISPGGMLAQVLAVAVGITRVMAMPEVSKFLERFVPWLAPEKGPKTQAE